MKIICALVSSQKMWLLLILCLHVVQSSTEFKSFLDPEYDFFKEFLIKYRNMGEDPCNNFFRHVCPRNLPKQASLVSLTGLETAEWPLPSMNYVNSQLIKATGNLPLYKDPLHLYDYRHLFNLVGDAYKKEAAKLRSDTVTLYMVSHRASMILSTRGNNSHPLSTFNFTRYTQMYAEMNQLLAEEINYPGNANYSDQVKELWEENYKLQTFTVGLMNETTEDAHLYLKTYVEYMQRYHKYLSDFDRPPFSPEDWHLRLDELLGLYQGYLGDILEKIPDNLRKLLAFTGSFNAFNYDQSNLGFTERVMLPVFRNDIQEEILLAVAGFTTGHEMFHSYANPPLLREDREKEFHDPTVFTEKKPCQTKHYESVCMLWREVWGDCLSGEVTWIEDGPDLEGHQLTYKLLKKRLGKKMKDIAYSELNITREQLYFYANTVVSCNSYKESQHSSGSHSGKMHRINGALSLLKGFQSAFNCKKEDKMVQRSQCNYFGSEIRR